MGGRRDSSSSASSTSSSSSSGSGSDSSSSTSGSGSDTASSCGEEAKVRGRRADVAQLQQQLQHVERLQQLRRQQHQIQGHHQLQLQHQQQLQLQKQKSKQEPSKRKRKRHDKKEKKKRKKDRKKKHKRKKHHRPTEPMENDVPELVKNISSHKMKSVCMEKKVQNEPAVPETFHDDSFKNNKRKRKLEEDPKDDRSDYQNARNFGREEHQKQFAKTKYSHEGEFEQNRHFQDKQDEYYSSKNYPQQKYGSENYRNDRPRSREREYYDDPKNRENPKHQRVHRNVDENNEWSHNNHRHESNNYNRDDRYPRPPPENQRNKMEDTRQHRHVSPHHDKNMRERDDRFEPRSTYSKPRQNDYEQRSFSNNRRQDNNDYNKRDYSRQEQNPRSNQNKEYHQRNDYHHNQSKNDSRYEKRYTHERDLSHRKDPVPSTSKGDEKMPRPINRESFDSRGDRKSQSSSNVQRDHPPRNNKRRSPQNNDWDEKQSYEWGKKEKKPQNNAAAPDKTQKDKPNFGLSGKLTEDTNMVDGVVLKYSEPPEGRQPKRRWRFYPFKGDKALPILYIHRQSFFLLGRDRTIADIPLDHPSISKQHAVLQYRLVPFKRDDGSMGKRVRPYIIDLGSSNGTFVNSKQIDHSKYVELLERDVVKFGFSQREYVLLHENSKEDGDMDDDDVKPNIKLEDEVPVKSEPND